MPISFSFDKNRPMSVGVSGEDLRITLKRSGLPLFLQCRFVGSKGALDDGCQVEVTEAILLSGSATPALVGWNVYAMLTNAEQALLNEELRKQANTTFMGWRAGSKVAELVPGGAIGARPVREDFTNFPRPSFPHHSCDNICVTDGCENMPKADH